MNMQEAKNYSTREKKIQLNLYWIEENVPIYSHSALLSDICNAEF